MKPALARFVDSWTYRPVDVLSCWIALFWAMNLIPDPEPVARVHVFMDSLVPLWVWGILAASVSALHLVSIHAPRLQVPRHVALFCGGGFWTCVAILFWVSGTSITGKGVYLSIACITLWHAGFLKNARK